MVFTMGNNNTGGALDLPTAYEGPNAWKLPLILATSNH